MIKINLLDSVTDRSIGATIVEQRVANPQTQTILLALIVGALLVLVIGYDFLSSRSAHQSAQKELDNQQRIAAQMAAVNKEQAELEKKTSEIQSRIDAIQKLRASQQGPSNVLREIKERFDSVPGLYLESVEQKGAELTIKGDSPNEASVTRFGRSLEFSSGLFSNLNIETTKKTVQDESGNAEERGPGVEVVSFTIKCNYSAPAAQPPATNELAQK